MAERVWVCNKCGRAGRARSQDEANRQHDERGRGRGKRAAMRCDYLPSWNWQPETTRTLGEQRPSVEENS